MFVCDYLLLIVFSWV